MEIINQNCECRIIQTKKTILWLVENTRVRTFDKITLEGYQRKVKDSHVDAIVKYLLEGTFYMPTSIICASDTEYTDSSALYVVDGQHRIKAFERLQEKNPQHFESIENFELSVIVLEQPKLEMEIDTFITINKKARKVDTSLALILKNKIRNADDMTNAARKEFVAVEMALALNGDSNDDGVIIENPNRLWKDRIMLEENPTQKSFETISLNSFVRTTRGLIGYLDKCGLINLNWNTEEELKELLQKVTNLYSRIWYTIEEKWPTLFEDSYRDNIIQGTIGVSAITKYIILQMQQSSYELANGNDFLRMVEMWIDGLNIPDSAWFRGNEFSGYSSESGFTLIANMLYENYEEYR